MFAQDVYQTMAQYPLDITSLLSGTHRTEPGITQKRRQSYPDVCLFDELSYRVVGKGTSHDVAQSRELILDSLLTIQLSNDNIFVNITDE